MESSEPICAFRSIWLLNLEDEGVNRAEVLQHVHSCAQGGLPLLPGRKEAKAESKVFKHNKKGFKMPEGCGHKREVVNSQVLNKG